MALTVAELRAMTLLALTEPPQRCKPGEPPGPEPPVPVEGPYLIFYSKGQFSLKTSNSSKNWNGLLEYSKDLTNWIEWLGEEIIAENGILYLRGTGNQRLIRIQYGEHAFKINSDEYVYCIGNIETLLDYASFIDGIHPKMADNCFNGLFYNCEVLRSAPSFPDTVIPFDTGAQSTSASFFAYMFRGCSNLLTGPSSLPKYGLGYNSCYSMFRNCTSLEKGPELPATNVIFNNHSNGNNCYSNMFYGCTSLVDAPDILVDRLPSYYLCSDMFYGCTSLKKAPKIYASGSGGYGNFLRMFDGCSSLEELPKINITSFGTSECAYMFRDCRAIKLSQVMVGEYSYEYKIPYDEVGVSRADSSFNSMFSGTGGTFTGTPVMNTTYYTDHEPV